MQGIPVREDPARYEERDFQDSDFVEIVSNDKIEVVMQYPLLGMKHAEGKCLMRREAAEKLFMAAQNLPEGYRFRIWDAWRPFALQQELYEVYSENIIRDFSLEKVSEEERRAVIRGFVSEPVPDREVPPAHTTGGAIDLTIVDADGNELEMGTGFDAFTEKTRTAYFERFYSKQENKEINNNCNFSKNNENEQINAKTNAETERTADTKLETIPSENGESEPIGSEEIRKNRLLLYRLMTDVGFTNLPSEWWHFDYGDRFWAYYNRCPAIYRGVFTREEMKGNGSGEYFR